MRRRCHSLGDGRGPGRAAEAIFARGKPRQKGSIGAQQRDGATGTNVEASEVLREILNIDRCGDDAAK